MAEDAVRPWWKKKWGIAAIAIGALIVAAGIAGEPSDDQDQTAAPATDEQSEPEPEQEPEPEEEEADPEEEPDPEPATHSSGCEFADGNSIRATPDCIDPWPLSVDEAFAFCLEGQQALIDTSAGRYPVNGMATSANPDLDPLEDIWLENPDIEGTRISIGPIIDLALDTC